MKNTTFAIFVIFTFMTLLIFTGCSQKIPAPLTHTVTVTKIKIQYIKVPMQFLNVENIPEVPKDISMQSDVANYIIDLYNNAISCHNNIDLIKNWNQKTPETPEPPETSKTPKTPKTPKISKK